MSRTDRPLTSKEYQDFKKQVADAEEAEARQLILERLMQLDEENQNLKVYIKVLEDLSASRIDKIRRLEDTLELLEQQLARLR